MAHETTEAHGASGVLANVAGRLGGFVDAVRGGMAERALEREDRVSDLETARQRFADLFWPVHAEYEPLQAAQIASIPRMRVDQAAPLVEAEMYRIAELLTPLMREAGFDLGSNDRHVRKEMTAVWNEAQGAMQAKAFGAVKLPLAFVWRAGQLAFEEQVWKRYGRRGKGYYGVISNAFYGHDKRVLAP